MILRRLLNSNDLHKFYKNIDNYNLDKENKILIVFDDMISDMINNKKLNSIVTESFFESYSLEVEN